MAEIGTVEFAYREYQHFMDGQHRRAIRRGEPLRAAKRDEMVELAAEFNGISAEELKGYIADQGRRKAGGPFTEGERVG